MDPNYITIGDPVKDSPQGAGTVTDITEAGYPRVNHVAVAWMERADGVIFDPRGVRDKHLAAAPRPRKGRSMSKRVITIEVEDDEVLVALKRPDEYDDVHPELVSEDAIKETWPAEYRTVWPKEPTHE